MIRCNIITKFDYNLFDQQKSQRGNVIFEENSKEDIVWDYIIVFDGINKEIFVKVRDNGLIFIAGEPPKARVYTKKFVNQFDRVYCAHDLDLQPDRQIKEQYFNNWHFGFSAASRSYRFNFDQLERMNNVQKTEDISVVTSNQKCIKDHVRRLKFLETLKENRPKEISYFGRGFEYIEYKEDALLPFRFHICVENCRVNGLWTEKLADPILARSVPIYCGCPNIYDYFEQDSFVLIDIDKPKEAIDIISDVLSDPVAMYEKFSNKIDVARGLILNKYNLVSSDALDLSSKNLGKSSTVHLKPNEESLEYLYSDLKMRTKRIIQRNIYNIFGL